VKIKNIAVFLDDEYEVRNIADGVISINNLELAQSHILLPTFQLVDDDMIVEVQIKQQQYASGVQPMVYVCIPVERFLNGKSLVGKASSISDEWILELSSDSSGFIKKLLFIFGMCSKRHQRDIVEILGLLVENQKNSVDSLKRG
jgi:hypothetical protein